MQPPLSHVSATFFKTLHDVQRLALRRHREHVVKRVRLCLMIRAQDLQLRSVNLRLGDDGFQDQMKLHAHTIQL